MDCPYISKTELNDLRHKAELPLYLICVIINFGVFSALVISAVYFSGLTITYYIAVIYIIVRLFLDFGHELSVTRLNSVRVTCEQFPGIYKWIQFYAKALGLRKIPNLYVRQLGGDIVSLSSNFFFRNYIMISSEIFECEEDVIKFFIAHEMAHIAYNHTKIWYNLFMLISRYIPFLYAALSRATVYSCDNVARALCSEGIDGICLMLVGNKLYKKIDINNYINQAVTTKGWFEFYANLRSESPVLVRRIPALYGKTKQRIF